MSWIEKYDLFLLDFDGLLVDTEQLHFQAYRNMCKERGYEWNWDFARYIKVAHYRSSGLEEGIYGELPGLRKEEPDWSVLYKEKRRELIKIYRSGPIPLMEGVEGFLRSLQQLGKKSCVVTHSDRTVVSAIREKNPLLDTIPHWVVREDYTLPKPNPECYRKAIELFAKNGERVIGFEDTPRGLYALMGTQARPVMVAKIDYPESEELRKQGVAIFSSFLDIAEV